jgi:hypothetical protein
MRSSVRSRLAPPSRPRGEGMSSRRASQVERNTLCSVGRRLASSSACSLSTIVKRKTDLEGSGPCATQGAGSVGEGSGVQRSSRGGSVRQPPSPRDRPCLTAGRRDPSREAGLSPVGLAARSATGRRCRTLVRVARPAGVCGVREEKTADGHLSHVWRFCPKGRTGGASALVASSDDEAARRPNGRRIAIERSASRAGSRAFARLT